MKVNQSKKIIAVIGGGITGLASAFYLQKKIKEEEAKPAESASMEKVKEEGMKKTQESGPAEYYTVKAGDTMYRISVQHHISLTKLLQMNNMQETDKIDIGQKIRVK